MKTWFKLLLLGAVTGAALTGCAENTPELYIQQNLPPDDECEAPGGGGADGTTLSRGTMDLLITNEYVMMPLVLNSLVSSESVGFGGGGGGGGGGLTGGGLTGVEWEANIITLSRAEVEFDAPDALGVPLVRSLDIPLAGSVQPGDALVATLRVIPSQVGNALRNSPFLRQSGSTIDMLLRVKFYGSTGSGREVDSNEFTFPVTLCFGCLLTVPPEAVDTALPTPNCRNIEGFESTDTETVCFAGQDRAFDCRLFCPVFGGEEDPTGICIPN
jgi:hypothetical protein